MEGILAHYHLKIYGLNLGVLVAYVLSCCVLIFWGGGLPRRKFKKDEDYLNAEELLALNTRASKGTLIRSEILLQVVASQVTAQIIYRSVKP